MLAGDLPRPPGTSRGLLAAPGRSWGRKLVSPCCGEPDKQRQRPGSNLRPPVARRRRDRWARPVSGAGLTGWRPPGTSRGFPGLPGTSLGPWELHASFQGFWDLLGSAGASWGFLGQSQGVGLADAMGSLSGSFKRLEQPKGLLGPPGVCWDLLGSPWPVPGDWLGRCHGKLERELQEA